MYKAYDKQLERYVALKILPQMQSLGNLLDAKCTTKAMAMSKVAHPNLAVVQSVIHCKNGFLCIVMDLVEGPSLLDLYIQRKNLHASSILTENPLYVAIEVLSVIELMEQQGIVHGYSPSYHFFLTPVEL